MHDEDKTAQEDCESQLDRVRTELDSLTYVIGHDLHSPIQGMSLLAEWLEEDIEAGSTDDAVKRVRLLRGRIDEMNVLLRDLVNYTQAGQNRHLPEWTDCDRLLKDIVEKIKPVAGFRVELPAKVPALVINAQMLRQCLDHLISNAIQHHDRDDGLIVVRYADRDGSHEFVVEDDGPGISDSYQDRIFDLFQTVPRNGASPGNGLGLAVVKKLVEQVGGEVRVRSPLTTRGSAFHVILPKLADVSKRVAIGQ